MSWEQLAPAIDAAALAWRDVAASAARLAGQVTVEEARLVGISVVAAMVLYTAARWIHRRLDRGRRKAARRAALARTLARQGYHAPEIARRTGLSRDALGMLLPTPVAVGRPNLPRAARIAVPAAANPRRRVPLQGREALAAK